MCAQLTIPRDPSIQIATEMETQVEKNLKNEMETGVTQGIQGSKYTNE